jgi:hypothetical protein
MNPLQKLKLHAAALYSAVHTDTKFFASVIHYVERLQQLLTGSSEPPTQGDLSLLAEKLEEFWKKWGPSDGGYIPPRQTADTDSTVRQINSLVRNLVSLDQASFQQLLEQSGAIVTDVALAFEGGEPGATKRPPRPPTEGIFNRLMIQQTALSGVTIGVVAFINFYILSESMGMSDFDARNRLLMLMVLMENYHVFNCRSEYVSAFRVPLRRNWMLVGGVLAAQGLHLLAMHVPPAQNVLHVVPISLGEWVVPFVMASSILVTMELFKFFKHGRRAYVPDEA